MRLAFDWKATYVGASVALGVGRHREQETACGQYESVRLFVEGRVEGASEMSGNNLKRETLVRVKRTVVATLLTWTLKRVI